MTYMTSMRAKHLILLCKIVEKINVRCSQSIKAKSEENRTKLYYHEKPT